MKTLSTDTSVAPECRAKSRGSLRKLKSLPEMFNLVAMNELAYLLENNSKLLQSASLTAEQATASINKHYIRLQELRSPEEFDRLFTKAEKIAGIQQDEIPVQERVEQQEHGEQILGKRRRTTPAYMTDYVVHSSTPIAPVTYNQKDELFRTYYETLDNLAEAVKTRFDQHDLQVLNAIESCLLNGANKEYSDLNELVDKLGDLSEVIDLHELKNELEELPVHIKLYNKESTIPVRKVTKISTLCDVLSNKQSSKAKVFLKSTSYCAFTMPYP